MPLTNVFLPRCLPYESPVAVSDVSVDPVLRPIHISCSPLPGSLGSCLVEYGQTKVVCSVDVSASSSTEDRGFSDKGGLSVYVKYANFARRRPRPGTAHTQQGSNSSSGKMSEDEKNLALQIDTALRPALPLSILKKSVLTVSFLVLQDDDSVLSASVLASSVAIALAGIAIYDIVTS